MCCPLSSWSGCRQDTHTHTESRRTTFDCSVCTLLVAHVPCGSSSSSLEQPRCHLHGTAAGMPLICSGRGSGACGPLLPLAANAQGALMQELCCLRARVAQERCRRRRSCEAEIEEGRADASWALNLRDTEAGLPKLPASRGEPDGQLLLTLPEERCCSSRCTFCRWWYLSWLCHFGLCALLLGHGGIHCDCVVHVCYNKGLLGKRKASYFKSALTGSGWVWLCSFAPLRLLLFVDARKDLL